MKATKYTAQNKVFNIELTESEIENLILYLGHARHAKGLDYLNYDNLGWEESAEIAKKQRNEIDAVMYKFNEILLTRKEYGN